MSRWEPVNSRIMVINLEVEIKMLFIQVYALTEDFNILEKKKFYAQLQRTVDKEAVLVNSRRP